MNIQTISLRDLMFSGRHGATQAEREIIQEFSIDLAIAFDVTRALATGNLADTIDYYDLVEIVKRHIEGAKSHILLETLVEEISCDLANTFDCLDIDLTIRKLKLPFNASVGLHRNFLQKYDTVLP